MGNIYELGENWKQVADMLYEKEIEEQYILDTLESIEGEIEDKADGYAKLIKNLLASAEAKKNEAKKMQEKAETEENRVKFLKNNLYQIMKLTGKTKFKTELFSFGIQKNGGKQALTIVGEVPENYCKLVGDNEKIRQTLEEGQELEFAYLEPRGEGVRIR